MKFRLARRAVTTGLLSLLLAACAGGEDSAADQAGYQASLHEAGWVGAWSAAPYGPYPQGPLSSVLPVDPLGAITLFENQQAREQSFRMVVHPTLGGQRLRLRFSNLMGDRPLHLEPVSVALRAAGPALLPGSAKPVLFAGQPGVLIAPGAEAISDPLDFAYDYGQDLAVSFHVVGESGPMTWHAVSFGLNYVSLPGSGDRTADATGLLFGQTSLGWFFLSGVDVHAPDSPGSLVMLGDSITDGAYEVPETNTRWPDFLAARLDALSANMGVLNQGINSNTVTRAGILEGELFKGPAAEDRFQRDVLDRSGVRGLLLFEGTNDLTSGVSGEALYAGLRRLVDRAHAAGLCVVLGTLMPRDDLLFGWDRASMEEQRQWVNARIRSDGGVEGIADFDAVMGSPLNATRPHPLLYSPDLLHPSSAGFYVMAQAVPLEALAPPPVGRCARR